MKPGLPWSVKGVEPDAREAAKAAARRDGVTLGVWLNRTIYAGSGEQEAPSAAVDAPSQPATPLPATPADPTAVTAADLQQLNAPLIAAVRNIEQATSKLADRLVALEKSQQEITLAAVRDIASEAARAAAESVGQQSAAKDETAPVAKEAAPKAPPPPPPSPPPRPKAPANDDAESANAASADRRRGADKADEADKVLPVPTSEPEPDDDAAPRPSGLRRFTVWTLATALVSAALLYGFNILFPDWRVQFWPNRTATTTAGTETLPAPPAATPETPVADTPPPAPAATSDSDQASTDAASLNPEDVALANSYRTEAEAGSAIAQYNLANLYADGKGVPRDDDQAAKWYLAAAEQDLPEAQYNLGVLHQLGRGVPPDSAQTLRWFFKAADEGNHIGAQHGLAVMYATGRGVTRDYAQAAKWFKRAAVQDHMDSKYNLGILYAQGLGVQADPGTAYVWFSLAAKQGDAEAGRRQDDLKATLSSTDVAAADAFVESWRPGNDVSIAAAAPAEPEELTRDAVRQAQRLLSRLGFEPGPADGVIGSRTERSVREFQEREGLSPDGRISAALIDRLKQAAES